MLTPDENGKFWHRGTKIGAVYGLIALVILGVTTTQDPEGSLGWISNKWFERFGLIASLLPLAAASQAYVAGRKDAAKSQCVTHYRPSVRKEKRWVWADGMRLTHTQHTERRTVAIG